MRRLRLNEMWTAYVERVLVPSGIPDDSVQTKETRRAFYAGALGLLSVIMRDLSPGDEPRAEDTQMLEEIERELEAFADLVQMGVA